MSTSTLDRVKSAVCEMLGFADKQKETLSADSNLYTLGADSLDNVELLMIQEEDFLVDLDDILVLADETTTTLGSRVDAIDALLLQKAKVT